MKNLTFIARKLRRNSTDVENKLWKYLRNRQLEGFKFRRQQQVGRYIVDFISFERKIIIELDGGQHDIYKEKDKIRDNWLKKRGFEVLRFWDNEVIENMQGVLETIKEKLLPHPDPLQKLERELMVIIICLISSFSSLAANWPAFGKDSNNTRYAPEIANPPLTEKWKFTAGSAIISSVSTSGGMIYFGSRDKKLYCLDAYTGEKKWEYATTGWVDSTPAISNGIVYFSSREGSLYALDAKTGELKWRFSTGGADVSSPLVSNGIVYAASGYPNTFVYAVNAYSGELIWKTNTSQYIYSSPALSSNTVYIGSNDGKFYAFDSTKGEAKFISPTSGEIYLSSPVYSGSAIYGAPGKYDKNIYAFDSKSGSALWSVEIADSASYFASNVSSPSLSEEGKLYIGAGNVGSDYILTCIDTGNHSILWQTKAPSATTIGTLTMLGFTSSPAATKDYIFIGSGDKKLYAIKSADGTTAESHLLDEAIVSSPVISNGWVYVGTLNGSLYAFESSEIVTISSPEFNEQKNGEISVSGMTKIAGFSSYDLYYGEGSVPSSWNVIAKEQKGQLNSIGTLGTLASSNLADGEYSLKLDVSTSSGIKTAKSSFLVSNVFAQAFIKASEGGTVTSADGTCVIIPPGAMNQDDTITISKPMVYPTDGISANAKASAVVREFSFASSNTKLSKYVTVIIPYSDSEIQGFNEEELRIYVRDTGKSIYKVVNTSRPDANANKTSAEVSFLGMYRLMEYTPGGPLLSEETTYVFPNPAKGESITFKCYLGDRADIKIDVYNIAGERIANLTGNGLGGMTTETVWNIKGIASGVYVFRVEAISVKTKEKMSVTKKLAIVH